MTRSGRGVPTSPLSMRPKRSGSCWKERAQASWIPTACGWSGRSGPRPGASDTPPEAQRVATCLFCQIVARQAPADIEYEDEQVLAFKDIYPKAPVHLLIVPKRH